MIYFITGIDTDAGKTFATGFFAKQLMQQGRRIITMKLSQTGCVGISDDIVEHRRIMGINLLPEDEIGYTCPYIFPFPASPHLSAQLDGKQIDLEYIKACVDKLLQRCDDLVIEGVGGLMVPLTPEVLLIDWVAQQSWPMVLVTSARLGSINHTLLSLEAIKHRNIVLKGVVFNHFPKVDQVIVDDTKGVIKRVLQFDFQSVFWLDMDVQ